MNIINIKLTKNQKKILATIAVISGIFIVFVVFIYLPMYRELFKLRKEYAAIESEISQTEKMAGEGKSLKNAISALKARLDTITNMCPAKEEGILKTISDRAEKFNINVISMNPDKKRVIVDIGGSPVNIKKDYVVQEMGLSMTLKANYVTFRGFLKSLKDDFPIYVRMDSVRLERTSDDNHPILNIDLKLRTYLICSK